MGSICPPLILAGFYAVLRQKLLQCKTDKNNTRRKPQVCIEQRFGTPAKQEVHTYQNKRVCALEHDWMVCREIELEFEEPTGAADVRPALG